MKLINLFDKLSQFKHEQIIMVYIIDNENINIEFDLNAI